MTHPADLFCRISYREGVVGDILCDHGASTYEGVFTYGVAADDGAVGPQSGALLDEGGANLIHLGDFRPWVIYVGEDHRRSAENAVFECDAFIYADVVLNLALIANDDIRANNNILADVAVFSYFRSGKDVGEVPNLGAFANFNTLIDYCRFMGEEV